MFNLENCKYDFASDAINIFVMVYDYSSSMQNDKEAMLKANMAFYEDFSTFEERGSIAIAKARFDSGFAMTSFKSVKEFDTNYSPYGNTKLFLGIVRAKENTVAYYEEIVKRLNIRPRITFIVFSDGEDNESGSFYNSAKEAITELNSMDVTTVFVAFNEAVNSGIGEALGFSCTKDINSSSELITCMGKELSKSCKEQSKSAFSLKSEFFSKADKNSEEDDKNNRAILDDDFFDI